VPPLAVIQADAQPAGAAHEPAPPHLLGRADTTTVGGTSGGVNRTGCAAC